MRTRWTWLGAAALCLLSATPAAAQPASGGGSAKQAARELADEALELFEEGDYQRAIEVFLAADRRYHAPTILFMVGQAHERLGNNSEAVAAYQRVVDERLERGAPREFARAQKLAQTRLDELLPRVASLRIYITGAPAGDTVVEIDGQEVELPAPDEPLFKDPGKHTIHVEAPGRKPITKTIMLQGGERRDVAIQLIPAPVKAPPPLTSIPESDPDEAPEIPTSALVSLVVGGVGLGIGITSGIMAQAKASELRELCQPPACAGSTLDERAQARALHAETETTATISTVSFIAGSVATAAGVTLLAVSPLGTRFWKRNFGVFVSPGFAGIKGAY